MKHFIDTQDFERSELAELLALIRLLKDADRDGAVPALLTYQTLAPPSAEQLLFHDRRVREFLAEAGWDATAIAKAEPTPRVAELIDFSQG